jgi:hypothetical protein
MASLFLAVLLSWKSAIYEINTSKVILVYLFWLLILDIAFILFL